MSSPPTEVIQEVSRAGPSGPSLHRQRGNTLPVGNEPPNPLDGGGTEAKKPGNPLPSGLIPSRRTYNTVDTAKSPPISGEQHSNTPVETAFSRPTGRLLCTLASVCVGRLISDFSPARCDRHSTLVYMAQVHGNRRKMGPANVGKMEDEYE